MKLLCDRCGIRGGSDLAFLWFKKVIQGKAVWLCPDCGDEVEGDGEGGPETDEHDHAAPLRSLD